MRGSRECKCLFIRGVGAFCGGGGGDFGPFWVRVLVEGEGEGKNLGCGLHIRLRVAAE